MNTKAFRLTMAMAVLVVSLGAVAPAMAATGTGAVTCEGDGVVAFEGFVRRIDVSGTGSVIYSKQGGAIWKDGTAWRIYNATGENGKEVTILIGSGAAHGRYVRDARVVLSAANGFLEVTGSGTLIARGEGYCETASGEIHEWNTTSEEVVLTVEE